LPLSLPEGLAALGFSAEDAARAAPLLERYCGELERYNNAFDLVNARNRDDLVSRHIFDSLAAAHIIRELAKQTGSVPAVIGDIGSGAGLPGIPLACVLPEIQFVLVERMTKRAAFLENCAALLALRNVRVENTEAERLLKAGFDVCVFRAFKPLDAKTARLLLSLLQPGGFLGAYKAKPESIDAELAAIAPVIGEYRLEKLENPFLPGHDRHLLIIPYNDTIRQRETIC
jgi:16S rRNA (guanine527-N7)-methyltransferase